MIYSIVASPGLNPQSENHADQVSNDGLTDSDCTSKDHENLTKTQDPIERYPDLITEDISPVALIDKMEETFLYCHECGEKNTCTRDSYGHNICPGCGHIRCVKCEFDDPAKAKYEIPVERHLEPSNHDI
jgi:hypothetical protein